MKCTDLMIQIIRLHKPQEITLPNGEWGTNCAECNNEWNYPCRTIYLIHKFDTPDCVANK